MQQFLGQSGYLASNVSFIPCSGLEGVNLVSCPKIPKLNWYSGPTLLECLGLPSIFLCLIIESIEIPTRSFDMPLRMSITNISKGPRANIVNLTGRLDSGLMQLGEAVISEPGGSKGVIKSKRHPREVSVDLTAMVSDYDDSSFCVAGDIVTVGIHGIEQNTLRYRIWVR